MADKGKTEMTTKEIDRIANDYLNNCESESDMLEVFALAKTVTDVDGRIDELIDMCVKRIFVATLDKIRAEIEEYSLLTRERVLGIIDKYKAESEDK